MGKLIKNNLFNFSAIILIAILAIGGFFYYSSTRTKGAEIQEIKIMPTDYSGSWNNQGTALIQDLGPDAYFEEFNGGNSTYPFGIQHETPYQSDVTSDNTGQADTEPIEEVATSSEEEILEELASLSEEFNDISTSSEEFLEEEIIVPETPASPSETSRLPFILGVILELPRVSELFGVKKLVASESVDISTIPEEMATGSEEVATSFEELGSPQFEDLGGEEILSTESEQIATGSEEVATSSEEILDESISEETATESEGMTSPSEEIEETIEEPIEPVVDFAPGFVESRLVFSGFDVPSSFIEDVGSEDVGSPTSNIEEVATSSEEIGEMATESEEENLATGSEEMANEAVSEARKKIKNVQLRMSLAFEGGGPQDSLIIEYSTDENWQYLAEFRTSDPNSNATNNGYWLYGLPIFENWEDLNNLKIRFTYRGMLPASRQGGPNSMFPIGEDNQPLGSVYLDALWLEVEYEGPEVEEEMAEIEEEEEEPEMAISEEVEVTLISGKKDFKLDEEPEFGFKYRRKKGFFENLVAGFLDLFRDEYKDIKIKTQIFGPNGKEIEYDDPEGFSSQIEYNGDGEFLIVLSKPRHSYYFKPGKYKLRFEIEDPSAGSGQVFIQEQEFTWGVLAINVNKSIYLPNEQSYLQMAVLDDRGHTICDANLKLEIKEPKNGLFSRPKVTVLSTEDGTIEYSGECGPNNVIDVPDYFAHYEISSKTGVYEMKLTNLDNGYEITDSFEVRESVLFDVERIGPTRIYPPATYEMLIKIKANQDFKGEIVERVPMLFAVNETEMAGLTSTISAKQEPNIHNYTKTLTWKEVEFKAGESYEIKYVFDAPDVSPYLYLMGPLRFYEYREVLPEPEPIMIELEPFDDIEEQVATESEELLGSPSFDETLSTESEETLAIESDEELITTESEEPIIDELLASPSEETPASPSETSLETKKSAKMTDLGNSHIVRDSGLSPYFYYSKLTDTVKVFSLTKNTEENSLVSFERRPVESNHIPSYGTFRVSTEDRIRPISASPYLRNNNYSNNEIKNNTFVEDAAFGSVNGDATSVDTQLQYSIPENLVKPFAVDNKKLPFVLSALIKAPRPSFVEATAGKVLDIFKSRGAVASVSEDVGSPTSNIEDLKVSPPNIESEVEPPIVEEPLKIEKRLVFEEARKWQIAADAVNEINLTTSELECSDSCTMDTTHDATGANFLVVGVSNSNGADSQEVVSVSYSEENLTGYCEEELSGSKIRTKAWYLVNPPTGGNNEVKLDVYQTNTAEIAVGAMSFSGVNTNDPLDSCTTDSGNSAGLSVGVSSSASHTVFSVYASHKDDLSVVQGVEQWNINMKAGSGKDGGGSTASGSAGTVTMEWSHTRDNAAISGFTIKHVLVTVSGTCKDIDQQDKCAECTGCVKAADDTSLDGASGNIDSAGAWSIIIGKPGGNSIVTVFLNGMAAASRSVAVMEYDGTGNITGIPIFEQHLTIGDGDVAAISNADVGTYDNEQSGDQDIFFDVDGSNNLEACDRTGSPGCEADVGIYIMEGVTYTPGGNIDEARDMEIEGTFNLEANVASLSGSWEHGGTAFIEGTSTVFLTATSSVGEIVSISGSDPDFYHLKFGDDTGTAKWSLQSALDVNGDLTIDAGTLDMNGSNNINLAGNLTINQNGAYTKDGGTITFDGSTSTWTDSATTKSDMGQVVINGAPVTVTLGSSVKVNELTIYESGETLDIEGYTLTISGGGTAGNRPLQNNGTFDAGANSMVEYIASTSTDINSIGFHDLKVASVGTTFNSYGNTTVSGSFNIDIGTFDFKTHKWTIAGSDTDPFTVAGTIEFSTSTISYEGDANITVASMSDAGGGYYNLAVGDNINLTDARTYTLNGNTSVSYDLKYGADSGAYTHVLNASDRTINLTGANDPFVKNTNGSFTESTSTVSYSGDGATTVTAETYYILDIGEDNNADSRTYTAAGNITASNEVNLQSAGSGFTNTFAMGNNDLNVGGLILNSGGISVPIQSALIQSSPGTTTIHQDTSGSANLGGGGTTTFYNLVLGFDSAGVSPYTSVLAGDIGVSGSFSFYGTSIDYRYLDVSGSNYDLSVWGNFTIGGYASLSARSGTITLGGNSGSTTYTNYASCEFYNLTINKTSATDADDNVTLSSNLIVRSRLAISDGQLIEGNANITIERESVITGGSPGGGCGDYTVNDDEECDGGDWCESDCTIRVVRVESPAEWTNIGTGNLTLGGGFVNAGSVSFDTSDNACAGGGSSDDIEISSTVESLRTWTNTGTLNLYNVSVSYQGDDQITCYSCTDPESTSTWDLQNCPSDIHQKHYRWRDDSQNLDTGGGLVDEDTHYGGLDPEDAVRLRVSLDNDGGAIDYEYTLIFAERTGDTCGDETFAAVTSTSSNFRVTGSDQYLDTDTTNNGSFFLTGPGGTAVDGKGIAYPSNETDPFTLGQNSYTEFEYIVSASADITASSNWCFMVTSNSENPGDEWWSVNPEIRVGRAHLKQEHYRWYQDAASRTALENQNTAHTDYDKKSPSNTRVVFAIENVGEASAASDSFELQWALMNNGTCEAVASNQYEVVPTSGDCSAESDVVCMVNSTHYEDQATISTKILDSPQPQGTFIEGHQMDTSNITNIDNQIRIEEASYTEVEFNLRVSEQAAGDTTYCFRVTQDGEPFDSVAGNYTKVAELTTKVVPAVEQLHYWWRNDDGYEADFGGDGVVVSDLSTGNDRAYAIASDSEYVYIAGSCNGCSSEGGEAWQIEKRRKSDGTLDQSFGNEGVVISDPTSNNDIPYSITTDDTYIYIAGVQDYEDMSEYTSAWRIEKRYKSNGNYDTNFAPPNGYIVDDIVPGMFALDFAYSITTDGSYIYTAGYCDNCGDEGGFAWMIQKRDITEGYLASAGSEFDEDAWGSTGSVSSDPSSGDDYAYSITINGSYIYIAGSCYGCGNPGYHAWMIQKRDITEGDLASTAEHGNFGNHTGSVSSDPSGNHDRAYSITTDGSYIYVAGQCIDCGDEGGYAWMIQKRDITEGYLASAGSEFDEDAWGSTGSVSSDPSSGEDIAYSITTDGSYIYIAGSCYDCGDEGNLAWMIQKRDITEGTLMAGTGDNDWGLTGSVTSDPTISVDKIEGTGAIVTDGTYIYIVGRQYGGGALDDGSSIAWRVEKRLNSSGALFDGATWKTDDIDTSINQAKETNVRLRFDINVASESADDYQYQLQWAPIGGGTCEAVASNQYTDVPIDGSCGNEIACMAASDYFSDQASTSQEMGPWYVVSDLTKNTDKVYAIASDSEYVYIAGYCDGNNCDGGTGTSWQIEKRRKSDGTLDPNFGNEGVVISNPTSYATDYAYAITVEGDYIYIAGTQNWGSAWRIEKRDKGTGDYGTDFGGGNGYVTSDPSGSGDSIYSITTDGSYIYAAGFCSGCGDEGGNAWMIQKRNIDDGYLASIGADAFGSWGSVSSDPGSGTDSAEDIIVEGNYIYIAGYCQNCGDEGSYAWMVQKRYISGEHAGYLASDSAGGYFGNHTGSVSSDPSDGSDVAYSITTDGSYIYTAGRCWDCGDTGSYAWMIQKRDITEGYLASAGSEFDAHAWGSTGSISSDPMSDNDEAFSVTIDGSYIYITGYQSFTAGNTAWRIEKRSKTDGDLASGSHDEFGVGGVVISNPTGDDDRPGGGQGKTIVTDGSYIYAVGYQNGDGQLGSYAWRLEKRDINTGRIDTFQDGHIVENLSNLTNGFNTASGSFNEVEFNFELTTHAADNTTYCFRATNNGTPLDSYAKVAEIRTGLPTLTQTHYRWRDDTTALNTTGGWLADEDTSANLTRERTSRLRFQIDNDSTVPATDYQYEIEYASKSGGSCGDDEGFEPITSTSKDFQVIDSGQYADEAAVTGNLLTAPSSTWANGYGVEKPSNETPAHSLTNDYYTEFEYAFQTTINASGSYCFRLTDSGTSTRFSYSIYAEATLPAVEQLHYWWRNDDGYEADFGGDGHVVSDFTTAGDFAYAIASDSEYLYIAGSCDGCGSSGGNAWVIEKRSKLDGTLDQNFGNEGVVISDPSSGTDQPYSITIEGSDIYVAGYCWKCGDEGNDAWHIEKRSITDGSLDSTFGGGTGSISSDPSNNHDRATSIIVEGDYIYIAGYYTELITMFFATNYAWMIQKRDIIEGYLASDAAGGYFGNHTGSVSSDLGYDDFTDANDKAYSITTDGSYIYTAGECYKCGDEGNAAWMIQKRDLTGDLASIGADAFGSWGSISSDPTSGNDVAESIIIEGDYIYVAGWCAGCGDEGGTAWMIQKRNIDDGYLASLSGDGYFGNHTGSVSSDPTSDTDMAYSITTDGSYIYTAGRCTGCGDTGGAAWMIQKRDLTGDLASTAEHGSFGNSTGSVSVDPSNDDDQARGIVTDGDYIYVAGFQDAGGGQPLGSYAWRLEKRLNSSGALFDGASWKTTDIDTSINQAKEENIRLRFDINVASESADDYQYQLQYAAKGGGTCEAVGSSSYTDVPNTTDYTNEIARMKTSAYFADQASTSQEMGPYYVVSDLTKNADYAYAIASDSEYVYIAGSCYGCGSEGGYAWHIEKRSKSDGTLDPDFGNEGVVISDPGSSTDIPYSIIVEGSDIYVAGHCYLCADEGGYAWHIEKRSITTGALDGTFGGGTGSVSSDPSNKEDIAKSIIVEGDYIYIAGYYTESEGMESNYNYAWMIQKRDITEGDLASDANGGYFGNHTGSVSSDMGYDDFVHDNDKAYSITTDGSYIYVAGYCQDCGDEGLTAWMIQKRDLTEGYLVSTSGEFAADGWGTTGSVSSDPSSGHDRAYSITTDGSYIYTAGYCSDCGDVGDTAWMVQKRDIDEGYLASTTGDFAADGWGATGSVSSDPTSSTDRAYSVTLDGSYIYTAGYQTNTGSDEVWRIEKRSKTDGDLASGSHDEFGVGGAVTVDITNDDKIRGIVVDENYVYAAGYQNGGGALDDGSSYAWRLEKRDINTGRIDTFQDGHIVEDTSNITNAFNTASGSFNEVEFNFELTTNATDDLTYCFRATNNGTPLDSYAKVAQVTARLPTVTQTRYRWRDDTTALNTSGGWLADEDTSANLTKERTSRLRFQIDNDSTVPATDYQYEIEYASKSGGACGDDEGFESITSTSKDFHVIDSGQYNNKEDITTNLLTAPSSTWANGYGVEKPSNETPAHSLTNDYYTEFEYAFKPTEEASGSYCFRLTDSGTSTRFSYSVYAEATMPTAEQLHYWWRNDDGYEADFGGDGHVVSDLTTGIDKAYAIASDSEYVYIAGYCNGCGSEGDYAWQIEKRSKLDGTLDQNFGNEGVVIHDPTNDTDIANAITADSLNIYVAGYCFGCGDKDNLNYSYHIASFVKSDGSYNTPFGGNGSVSHDPTSINADRAYAITADSLNIYVAGGCNKCGDEGAFAWNIASFTIATGGYNGDFGVTGNSYGSVSHDPTGSDDRAYAITADDSNIYVAGYCTGCGDTGGEAWNIASFTIATGGYNGDFGVTGNSYGSVSHDPTGGSDRAYAITADDSNIYVAGRRDDWDPAGGKAYNIAAFVKSTGGYYTSFGEDGSVSHDPTTSDDEAYAITADSSNIYVAGPCTGCGDQGGVAWNIAAINKSNGNYDTGFGSGGSISSDPSSGGDIIQGIVTDGTYIYIAGWQSGGGALDDGSSDAWRLEKRSVTDGALFDGATWKTTDIDTSINQAKESNVRLRFDINVASESADDYQYQLQWAPIGGGTCEAVASDQYTDVPIDGSCGSEIACMAASNYFADQASTSQEMGPYYVVSDLTKNADYAYAIASDSEYVYIAGYCDGNNCDGGAGTSWVIEKRRKSDGILDPDFGNEGVVIHDPTGGDDKAYAIIADDSNLYIAGECSGCGDEGSVAWNIASFTVATGGYNGDFGVTANSYGSISHDPTDTSDRAYAITSDDSNLYVAGYRSNWDPIGGNAYNIASFVKSDGSYNNSFGGDGSVSHDPTVFGDNAYAITSDDSNLYVAGYRSYWDPIGGNAYNIASFVKSDGSYNTSFGGTGSVSHDPTSGTDIANSITADSSNIYVAGYQTEGGNEAWNIVAFNKANGNYDTDFGSNGYVTSDPTSDDDKIRGIVNDGSYIYTVGFQDGSGQLGSYAWRLEKRDINTGRIDTFQDGHIVEDTSNITNAFNTASGSFNEVEFNFELTTNAADETTYCFRTTNNGTPLDSYAKVAQIRTGLPELTQTHYRWRDDSTVLNTSGGWLAAEDTSAGLSKENTARLRFSIDNTGDIPATNYQYEIEYASKSGGACNDDEGFEPITSTSKDFQVIDPSQYNDKDDITTNLLTAAISTWANGESIAHPSNETEVYSLTNDYYTEFEYAFQPTEKASGSYCFRLTDSGTSTRFSYSVYAEATMPTVEQLHYWWRNDDGYEADFGGDGYVVSDWTTGGDFAYAIASDSEYLYIAGSCYGCGSDASEAWVIEKRSKLDGQLDQNFGNEGVVISDPTTGSDVPYSIFVESSDIYIAGYCQNCGDEGDYAWHIEKRSVTDGSLDSTFGGGTGSVSSDPSNDDDRARSIIVEGDYIYIAGYYTEFLNMMEEHNYAWMIQKRDITEGYLASDSAGGYFGNHTGSVSSDMGYDNFMGDNDMAHSITTDGSYIYTAGECYKCGDEGGHAWMIQKRDITEGYLASIGADAFGSWGSISSDPTNGNDVAESITVDGSYIYTAGYCTGCGDEGGTAWMVQKRNIDDGYLASLSGDGYFGNHTGSVSSDFTNNTDFAYSITVEGSYIYTAGYCTGCGDEGGIAWVIEKRDLTEGDLASTGVEAWGTTGSISSDPTDEGDYISSSGTIVTDGSYIYVAGFQYGSGALGDYAWRIEKRDVTDGALFDGATWKTDDIDTSINQAKETNVRLRFDINVASESADDYQYQLQWAPIGGGTCEAVASNQYTDVPIDGSCGNEIACMAASDYFSDQASTSQEMGPWYVVSDLTTGGDRSYAIASDSEYVYIAGYCSGCGSEGGTAWAIEKRRKSDGQLDPDFGNEGVVISDPSNSSDQAYSITTDGSYIYTAGYCTGCGDEGNLAWHIEKRSVTDGSLDGTFGSNTGSVSSDPSSGPDRAYSIIVEGNYIYTAGSCNECGGVGDDAWMIQKRDITEGYLASIGVDAFGSWGSVISDVSKKTFGTDNEIAYSITTDGSYIYVAGSCYDCGDVNNDAWMIQKRNIDDGYLASLSGDGYFGNHTGSIISDPSSGGDIAYSITTDGSYIYTAGYCQSCGYKGSGWAWYIEKRDLTGDIASTGGEAWGSTGLIISDPTISTDIAYSITTDGSYIYTAGYQLDSGDVKWRIEKRSKTDGDLASVSHDEFGVGGVVTSNPTGDDDKPGDGTGNTIVTDGNYVYIVGQQDGSGQLGDYAWRLEKRDINTGRIDTFQDGHIVEDTSNLTNAFNTASGSFNEVEFNFELTTDAAEGITYCFRVTNNGTPLDSYAKVAQVTATTANVPPTIHVANVYGADMNDNIILIENTAIDLMATITIDDDDGCDDIQEGNVEAWFLTSDIWWNHTTGTDGSTCSYDENNCYDNTVVSCSYASCAGNVATYQCVASAAWQYFADATEIDSQASKTEDEWIVIVYASDSYGNDVTSDSWLASDSANVNLFSAIDVEQGPSDSITYGTVTPGNVSSTKLLGIRNTGNRGVDPIIEELGSMSLNGQETEINTARQQYAAFDFTITSDGTSLSADNLAFALDITLPQRGSGDDDYTSISDDQLYWGIDIPYDQTFGDYKGSVSYTSTPD